MLMPWPTGNMEGCNLAHSTHAQVSPPMVCLAALLGAASYGVIVLGLIPLSLQIFHRSPMDCSCALSRTIPPHAQVSPPMVCSAALLDAASYRMIVLSLIPLLSHRSPMDSLHVLSHTIPLSGFCNLLTAATINALKVSTAPDLDAPIWY